ncbi:hypothetical protein BU17DRAFT_99130 [Hysterangium stoloniferum]|nr:hypothetical protein BU17DRAFT_99130 [Hysterangium stoloniferum]
MTGWAALSRWIRKLKRGVKPPPTNTILETTGNVARLALDGTKESADAFPPLKSAVGGTIFFLDSFEQRCKLLDSKTLPQELQNMYNELMSFVADVKAKAVNGQRRLKGGFGVINLREEEQKMSSLNLEFREKLDKFEVTRKHLYDQLVLKNQLQHIQDQTAAPLGPS